jgi:hypothetical protein
MERQIFSPLTMQSSANIQTESLINWPPIILSSHDSVSLHQPSTLKNQLIKPNQGKSSPEHFFRWHAHPSRYESFFPTNYQLPITNY